MITTNTGAKKIENTDNWRQIFDDHNDSVDAHDKMSDAMTYVVCGNKSVETVSIPVDAYFRLVNSQIVGRSDGLYTAKIAIPVDTVIDSSYFNEVSPIVGGVANALNDNLTQLEEKTYRYYDEGEHLFPIPASGDASVKIPNFRVTEAYMILFSSGNASAWYYYGIYFSANQAPFIETIKAVGISVSANGDTLTFHNSNSGYPVWGKLKII